MASPKYKITIDMRPIYDGIDNLPQRLGRGMAAIVRRHAPLLEGYAKVHAPWTDRTSNARNTLNATTEHATLKHKIVLAHGMPYGIYLETMQDGRFAIILPSITQYGPKVMQDFEKLLEKI